MTRGPSRRAVLTAAAGTSWLGVLWAAAGCSTGPGAGPSAGPGTGTGTGRPAPPDGPAATVTGGSGSGAALTPTALDAQVLRSRLPLPPPFRRPLPVPASPAPRRTEDADHYDLVQTVSRQQILPGVRTTIWGYDGTFPGPTLVSTSGRRTVVHHRNALPVPTVVHLHGGRTPAGEDGYPTDLVLPSGTPAAVRTTNGTAAAGRTTDGAAATGTHTMPGMTTTDPQARISHGSRDYTYPMDQRAATLWYHDHRMGFTGPMVHRGLAGFHLVHDDEELALPLPRGERDVPLMICDRAFDTDGEFRYPSLDPELATPGVPLDAMKGVMGDVFLVNGAPWPELRVGAGRYRFRILNACNARILRLVLRTATGTVVPFTQIGTDGGLLPGPVRREDLLAGPAQRFDVVVDFGGAAVGDQFLLLDEAGGDSAGPAGVPGAVMRFTVDRTMTDTTAVPARLSASAPIRPPSTTSRRRMDFRLDWGSLQWTINGRPFDPAAVHATVTGGSTEVWEITSDAHHTVHVHLAQVTVLDRDGAGPGPYDGGLQDTVLVGPEEVVRLAVRFPDLGGRYLVHCHNLEHEDMAMMANIRVSPAGAGGGS